jgi:phosphatidate cytidylyltransferase
MVLISGADIGAYFSGRMWGNKKLLPNVSPNKTRVGLCGGLLLGLSVAFGGILIFPQVLLVGISPIEVLSLLSVSFITIIFSVLGDFFESMLKREAGLKDSGAIFPGHGGVLDRIDSLTAAAPIFLFGLLLINMKI